ncbi:MAG: EamA family transporter, partial [Candidatus Ranarchaeia archaeon]
MIPILLALLAAGCFGVGALLQKKGLGLVQVNTIYQNSPLIRPFILLKQLLFNRYWFSGGVCSVLGWLSYFSALTISEYLDIRPLTNLSLVIALIGGSYWFKENLTKKEIVAISLILFGALALSTQLAEAKALTVDYTVLFLFLLVLAILFMFNLSVGLATNQQ